MSDKSELRDEPRRLIIANGMIGQFIYDATLFNLSAGEPESLFEDVEAEARIGDESGGDGWMDLDPSAQQSHKLHLAQMLRIPFGNQNVSDQCLTILKARFQTPKDCRCVSCDTSVMENGFPDRRRTAPPTTQYKEL
jgi:hypothetical protein